jgi:hypothetical protein
MILESINLIIILIYHYLMVKYFFNKDIKDMNLLVENQKMNISLIVFKFMNYLIYSLQFIHKIIINIKIKVN